MLSTLFDSSHLLRGEERLTGLINYVMFIGAGEGSFDRGSWQGRDGMV